MYNNLIKIIDVNKDKCVNCQKCIAVCPVHFCNDGSGDYVKVNGELCLGCCQCLKACTHGARVALDDSKTFFEDMSGDTQTVASVAPSVASNFPHEYMKLNGWLKSIGISAIFDVSFGAELTIRSYLEHLKANNPKLLISQPCPAIVNYIELYRPELLQWLAPVDSPMIHTIKMIREFYPEYNNHRIAAISPCVAKKREFAEVGLGDYNVTYNSLKQYFKDNNISLDDFPELDYDNRYLSINKY